jgi:polyhydroxybutyrate depolymerase
LLLNHTMYRSALTLAAVLWLVAAPASAARPSFGCGLPPPLNPPTTVNLDGQPRDMIVAVPPGYSADRVYPLVLGFHGRTNDNQQVRQYYDLEKSSRFDAIYVYPAGLRDGSGKYSWYNPGDRANSLRDYALFDRLLTDIGARYCVDQDQVFVVGHSLGASFANSLACARSDRIRAVGSVGGGISPTQCSGKVAALLLHNPDDQDVSVKESERARDALVAQNGSPAPRPRKEKLAGFDCDRYGKREGEVLWCLHHQDYNRRGRYYPHQWPKEASAAIMEFFAEQKN